MVGTQRAQRVFLTQRAQRVFFAKDSGLWTEDCKTKTLTIIFNFQTFAACFKKTKSYTNNNKKKWHRSINLKN